MLETNEDMKNHRLRFIIKGNRTLLHCYCVLEIVLKAFILFGCRVRLIDQSRQLASLNYYDLKLEAPINWILFLSHLDLGKIQP